ncbi:MAG: hypothetical protein NT133_00950 [Alphaproteobacteria bacterium]|nr:hypothetical protein [Alphaproteobacteria bacterium]
MIEGEAAGWFAAPLAAVEQPGPPACAIVIDTEEDFSWIDPVEGTPGDTLHLRHLLELQAVFAAFGAIPAYMVTWRVLEDADAVALLRRECEAGRCTLGLHLHPWVTPPLLGVRDPRLSFAGNLAPGVEAAKLRTLATRFAAAFGFPARSYRAGRYGLGPATPALLEEIGITVDTSVAPRSDFSAEGGPDYGGFDYAPFWFGATRRVLELPLGRAIVGHAGARAAALYRLVRENRGLPGIAASLVSRLRLAERMTLSPEDHDAGTMIRLVRGLAARGQTVYPVSFHSSSIWPGRNPYVTNAAERRQFYDRLSAVLAHMRDRAGARFIALDDIPGRFAPPAGRK